MEQCPKPLTSIADFYNRVKTDERYRTLLLYAFRESSSFRRDPTQTINYDNAIKWVEKWLVLNGHMRNCSVMCDYLNKCMKQMAWLFGDGKLISATEFNTFVRPDK